MFTLLMGVSGAWAQTATLMSGYGDPLTLTQFKALAVTTGRFAFVASSNTAADNAPRCDHWCGFTSTHNTTTLSEDYLFYLEASGDNYKVKRASDGKYVSTSTSSTSFVETGGSEFKLVNRDPNDATKAVTGEQSISFEDPTNSSNHYNANAVKYNGGTGAWTTYAVFGPIYIVTVKFVDTNNSVIQSDATYFVKANTELSAPFISGYAVQGTSSYTITADQTVTFTYNALPAFDPNDVAGKTFTLQCARGYIYGNGSQVLYSSTASDASEFAIVSYDNHTYLYDATNRVFVCNTALNHANNTGNAALESNSDFSKIVTDLQWTATSSAYFLDETTYNNRLNASGNTAYFNTWKTADGGNQFTVTIASTNFDETDAVDMLDAYFNPPATVTYVISDASGVIYTSEASNATIGETINSLPAEHQRPYCTYSVTSTTIVSGINNVPVTVTYNLPFTVSSSFNDATWYYATLRGTKYVRADESHKDGSGRYQTNSTNERTDVYKWAFFGNPYSNFYIANKGAGEGKYLYAGSNPTMQSVASPTQDNKALWALTVNASTEITGGSSLRSISGDNLYINDNGGAGNLGFWNSASSANNIGSVWKVEEVTASDKAALGDAIALAQALVATPDVPGYPTAAAASTLSGAIPTAQSVYNDASGDYGSAYHTLVTAINTAKENINYIPRTDVYYTITSARGSMVYDSSHDSSTDAEGNNFLWYTTSLDNTNINHLWGFIEQDGKYYMYNVGKQKFATVTTSGSYQENDRGTWAFSDAPAYVTFDAGINNSVAAPYVRVRATVATTGNTYSMSISPNYTGPVITYDAQGDGGIPMQLAESSVAVDASVTDIMTSKVTDLTPFKDALKNVIDACASISIGTGLNQYASNSTYTDALAAANTTYNDASATQSELQTATSNLETAIAGLSINLPATGKFYRIKGYSDKYITSGDLNYYATMNATTSTNNIIYYSADNNLIFYGSGYGLYNTCYVAPVGSTLNAYTFSQGAQMGHYYVRSNYSGGGQYCYDHEGSDAGDILNRNGGPVTSGSYQTDWTLEEITSLPVTISASGWATFYAPVALTIPSGVTAYTATVSGTELTKVEVSGTIPANTGVLLYADIDEATTYSFAVAADVTAITGNVFAGTTATINKPDGDVYVLAKGNNGLGFYKYAGNTLAGFKAYIPASALSGPSASFISFADDDPTAVASAINGETLNGQYYDLTGRKVVAPQKGNIYIVNGKKVLY